MRHYYSTLSARDVTALTLNTLAQALAWASPRVEPRTLLQLLISAAAQMRSLSAVVASATLAPCYETVRQTISSLLPSTPRDFDPLITSLLHSRLPRTLRRRPRTLAVDLHLRPYYGSKATRGTFRGQRKAGTKTFFAYATLLLVQPGRSFTVGLTPVTNGEEQTAILDRLFAQAREAGLSVKCLLLDRGFYAATTMAWLQKQAIAFVMPMIRRGRSERRKADCTGTERFFVKGRRGWDTYTWTARPRRGGRKQKAIVVTIDVCMAAKTQTGSRAMVYACHGIRKPPGVIAALYRRRFGIETSYRQLGEGLAATCSRDARYRLLLVLIALVLRNVWVWLHGEVLSERVGSVRRVQLHRLRLRRMMSWLVTTLDRLLRTEQTCKFRMAAE